MSYLFLLGRNFKLSRAELLNFCDEIYAEPDKSLFIGKNLKFENPRNLPRKQEQLFLDRLGGTIRFGKILGEFASQKEVVDQIVTIIEQSTLEKIQNRETDKVSLVPKVGLSIFGGGKSLLGNFMGDIKVFFADQQKKVRIENFNGKNMTSGQIFDRRLLLKGNDFVIWKKGNTFLLAQTVANQNLRNYTLRDRKKSFRDAKMGMLPPKLAQILINLSKPTNGEIIIDPFCGSGTVNVEAAIMGFKTEGSDLNASYIKGAENNFTEMSAKFRYEADKGTFSVGDVLEKDWKNKSGIICTEGFLGTNFTKTPTLMEIESNARVILKLWTDFFKQLKDSDIKTVSLCLPCWYFKGKEISISTKLEQAIKETSFTLTPLFRRRKTFIYKRDKTFVAREIGVFRRF